MSKFDRADPSLDRDYTDGLSADTESEPPACFWCGQIIGHEAGYYCSALCAVHAETDDCER